MSINVSELIQVSNTGFKFGNLLQDSRSGELKEKIYNSLICMLANYTTKTAALKKVIIYYLYYK